MVAPVNPLSGGVLHQTVRSVPVWHVQHTLALACAQLLEGIDSIHQLDRAAQVTIFRLRTGHCLLLSHLHRLKISHSDECPCGTGPQTPNHILQSCPTFDYLRRQTWPSPVEAHRKLWGPVETLRQTADFALLAELKIWHGREHRRRRRRIVHGVRPA